MRNVLLLCALFLSVTGFSQGWAKRFDEASPFNQQPWGVAPHPAGGVLVMMYNDSIANVPLLYRIDQDGQLLWVKQPLDSTYWMGWYALLYNDSAFYMFVNGGNAPINPMTIVKLDLNGDTVWTHKDSVPNNSVEHLGSDVRANGNLLFATQTYDWLTSPHIRFAELDSSGNIVWDSTYLNLSIGYLLSNRLRCTADGGFYLHYMSPGIRGAYKFSPTGNIIDTIQTTTSYPLFLEAFPTADTGSLLISLTGAIQFQFLRLKSNGDTLWTLITDTMQYVGWPNIIENQDGSTIIGFQGIINNCERVPSIMKIDSSGNIIWFHEYYSGGVGNDVHFVLDHTAGFYYTGRTSPCYFAPGTPMKALIVRFDTLGRVYSNNISGTIFYDNASDCVFNSGDTYSHHWMVEVNGNSGPFYVLTDSLGNYSVDVSTGTYIVTQHINSSRTPVCPVSPNSHTISFTSTDTSASAIDFANIFIPNQPDLSLSLVAFNAFRPGGVVSMRLTCKNNGSTTLNGNITASHDTFLQSSSFSTAPSALTSGSIVWNYSNLLPDEELIFNFHLNVPTTAQQGQSVNVAASAPVPNDINSSDNYFQWTDSVRTSYDPNDKRVTPAGWGTEGYIYANDELTFVIRFQNTGTDTAFNIVVADQIHPLLDLSTFQFVSSSHYCVTEISPAALVKFTFNNILLPDSNVNEMFSHGYVCFRIRPKQNVLPGDIIVNGAAIYFDYNEAVMTNQTLNTIADPNAVQEVHASASAVIKVYPNPASSYATFIYSGIESHEMRLQIWNVNGQLVEHHDMDNSGEFRLNTTEFEPGIYLWTLVNNGDVIGRDRLVIVR